MMLREIFLIVIQLLAVSAMAAPVHFKNAKGSVTVSRQGKILKSGVQITGDFEVQEKDLIKVDRKSSVRLVGPSFELDVAPQSLLTFDLNPTAQKPGLFTLIYGHVRLRTQRKVQSPIVDVLRFRIPGFWGGVKTFSSKEKQSQLLIHVNRSQRDYLDRLQGKSIASEPRVVLLSDMKIFEKLYLRVESVKGVASLKSEDSGKPTLVEEGQYWWATPQESSLEPLSKDEISEIEKAFDFS